MARGHGRVRAGPRDRKLRFGVSRLGSALFARSRRLEAPLTEPLLVRLRTQATRSCTHGVRRSRSDTPRADASRPTSSSSSAAVTVKALAPPSPARSATRHSNSCCGCPTAWCGRSSMKRGRAAAEPTACPSDGGRRARGDRARSRVPRSARADRGRGLGRTLRPRERAPASATARATRPGARSRGPASCVADDERRASRTRPPRRRSTAGCSVSGWRSGSYAAGSAATMRRVALLHERDRAAAGASRTRLARGIHIRQCWSTEGSALRWHARRPLARTRRGAMPGNGYRLTWRRRRTTSSPRHSPMSQSTRTHGTRVPVGPRHADRIRIEIGDGAHRRRCAAERIRVTRARRQSRLPRRRPYDP